MAYLDAILHLRRRDGEATEPDSVRSGTDQQLDQKDYRQDLNELARRTANGRLRTAAEIMVQSSGPMLRTMKARVYMRSPTHATADCERLDGRA